MKIWQVSLYFIYFLTSGDVTAATPANYNDYLENMDVKHFVPRPFLRIGFVYFFLL